MEESRSSCLGRACQSTVTRLFVEEIILECRKKHITRVDILGFEFEMGLFRPFRRKQVTKESTRTEIHSRDVFDKRAVEKNQVVFHDVAAIEVARTFQEEYSRCRAY
jgi:hypothetical protein